MPRAVAFARQTVRFVFNPLACLIVGTTIFILAFTKSNWPPGHPVHEAVEFVGMFLILVSFGGNVWCSPYVSKSTSRLVIVGPYSLCRHPQYLFAIFRAVGIGALVGTITIAVVSGVVVLAVLYACVIEEEKHLRGRFDDAYVKYRQHVPMFLPDLALECGRIDHSKTFSRNRDIVRRSDNRSNVRVGRNVRKFAAR
ncbi:MAG: methyltransferase family protein [Xanthobacteraceae bacterium]